MRILAIETSCDDTCVAILEASKTGKFSVLANIVASQIEVHKKYGGVYPFMAKREHEKNLGPTLKEAFLKAKISEKDIDLIVVTNGLGLEPCLWVGVNFAKDLAKKINVPLIPVNHIESHILVNFLNRPMDRSTGLLPIFPAVALVVSGGHTQLVLMKKIGSYKILGETRDDAAGECFDKCAKILGLGYPGGPEIAKLAEEALRRPTSQKICDVGRLSLPRPMMFTKDYDFSFSGLKTAVLYSWQKTEKQNGRNFHSSEKSYQLKISMAKEIQQAIIDVLLKKTIKAARDFKAKTIILGGGVSANSELRTQFEEKIKTDTCGFLPYGKKPHKITLLAPKPELSTDNGLMAAITAWFHRGKKISAKNLRADANLRIE